MTFATLTEYELQRAAALVRRDNRARWVEVGTGRIHAHRPEVESVRVAPTARAGCVAYAHQPARA